VLSVFADSLAAGRLQSQASHPAADVGCRTATGMSVHKHEAGQ
jgi:hypothetical protein